MIIQALCTTLFNNCPLALHTIEKEGQTIQFFTALVCHIPRFKKEFEIRRVLFGMTAILRTPIEHLPPLVAAKQPDLFKEIGTLAIRNFKVRKECLEENEEHLAKGLHHDDDDAADEYGDEDSDQDEEVKTKLAQFNDADFEDHEDDSDYEVEGDDGLLYDSMLDEVDELVHLKETVDAIN